MDELCTRLATGESMEAADVYKILSDELSSGKDSREVAHVAFDIYSGSETPDIRFLEMAISCMKMAISKSEEYVDPDDIISYSVVLHERYLALGRTEDLEECIYYNSAVCDEAKAMEVDHPSLALWLGDLGVFLSERYIKSGNPHHFDAAIGGLEEAIEATAKGNINTNTAEHLLALGLCWDKRYEQTRNLGDLTAAIRWFQASVEATPEDHPRRGKRLTDYGTILGKLYTQTHDPHDFYAARVALEEAQATLRNSNSSDMDRGQALHALAVCWEEWYKQTKNLVDLTAAIGWLQASVEATPGNHPRRGNRLSNYGAMLVNRYNQTHDLHDIDAAIVALQEAEAILQDLDDTHRADRLKALGMCWQYRYRQSNSLEHLEVAITWFEKLLQATREGDPERKGRSSTLGSLFGNRYQRTRNSDDLNRAIVLLEAAIEETWEVGEGFAQVLHDLGFCLYQRYKRTGNLENLEAAITHTQEALKLEGTDRQDQPESSSIIGRGAWLNSLGNMLSDRYQHTGNLDDLNDAIARLEILVEAAPDNLEERLIHVANLGGMLCKRFDRTGNPCDFEAGIARMKASVELIPENHAKRGRLLCTLGATFSQKYRRSEDLADFEAAIFHYDRGLAAMPADDPWRGTVLSNRGLMLGDRYKITGNILDLEDGVALLEAALKAATPDNYQEREIWACNLGLMLRDRYRHTGNLHDLDAAIVRIEGAVRATPPSHIYYAIMLNNFAMCLYKRYNRTKNLQDLDVALSHQETALDSKLEDHPQRAIVLNTFGCLLMSRFEKEGNPQDLQSAIPLFQRALEVAPKDDPDRKQYLHNLGVALNDRYFCTGGVNVEDLEAAIASHQASIAIAPSCHPYLVHAYYHLGERLLHYLSVCEDRISVAQQALDAWLAGWSITSAPTSHRLRGVVRAAKFLTFSPYVRDLPRACSLLQDAIHLLPLATPRSLEREDQQHILATSVTGLVSLAVSLSLETGQPPSEALRLLELGRSVTNGQLLDYRSDISDLAYSHPVLANEFDRLRTELDRPLPESSGTGVIEGTSSHMTESSQVTIEERVAAQQALVNRRNKVANDLDTTLQKIRQQPGFENFLRGESLEYMLSAASEGPIVVLNITKLRGDAILVTQDQVTSLCLPQLSHPSMTAYLREGCGASVQFDHVQKRKLLEWLWKAAVQPVLQKLGFYPKVIEPLPRIWFIGVGLMALAPLHAAAIYRRGALKMSTLDYCIPSYTSTIRALKYSRSKRSQTQLGASLKTLLIVTMPTTPGQRPLDVDTEAKHIQNSTVKKFDRVQILTRPSAESVLELLPDYNIVHFACHGISTPSPADSHLLLLKKSIIMPDGQYKEETDRLRVKDIAAKNFPAARLAYLSACNTAGNVTEELADEVTHIASSFHIAGFMHVIGTLWPADDSACNTVAEAFYASLSDTDDVAVSYRKAVMAVMKQKPMAPMYWAPYIHFGA